MIKQLTSSDSRVHEVLLAFKVELILWTGEVKSTNVLLSLQIQIFLFWCCVYQKVSLYCPFTVMLWCDIVSKCGRFAATALRYRSFTLILIKMHRCFNHFLYVHLAFTVLLSNMHLICDIMFALSVPLALCIRDSKMTMERKLRKNINLNFPWCVSNKWMRTLIMHPYAPGNSLWQRQSNTNKIVYAKRACVCVCCARLNIQKQSHIININEFYDMEIKLNKS